MEAEAKALAVPQDWMGNTVFCTSLADEELGHIHAWGTLRFRAGSAPQGLRQITHHTGARQGVVRAPGCWARHRC
jgi:hypothetical protein